MPALSGSITPRTPGSFTAKNDTYGGWHGVDAYRVREGESDSVRLDELEGALLFAWRERLLAFQPLELLIGHACQRGPPDRTISDQPCHTGLSPNDSCARVSIQ